MNVASLITSMVSPLRTRILNMISRAILDSVDDAKKIQIIKASLLAEESREMERFQNYGFTSHPKKGAEALAVFVGGRRDHGVVIAIDDRRYRLKSLAEGEVAVYDDVGSKIVLKHNGDIELVPNSGKVKVTGDLEASGDVKAGSVSLTNHTHTVALGACTAGGATGTVETSAP